MISQRMSEIIGITICVNYHDYLEQIIAINAPLFKKWYIVTDPSDEDTIQVCKKYDNVEVCIYDKFYENASFNKSGALFYAQNKIHQLYSQDWVMVLDADIRIPHATQKICKEILTVLDTDAIYTVRRVDFPDATAYAKQIGIPYTFFMAGYLQMYFDKLKYYPSHSSDASKCDETFKDLFEKKYYVHDDIYVHHLGMHGANWTKRTSAIWTNTDLSSHSRDLIYYVIGGDTDYASLLRLSIESLRRHPENRKYDILIICDPDFAFTLHDLSVQFYLTWKNKDHIQASMRKMEIFQYPRINEYSKALYLDCDTVITGSLQPLFDAIHDDNVLYCVPELQANHEQSYYHCRDDPYTPEVLASFAKENIYPFNCGQFALILSENMQQHFTQVAEQKLTYDPSLHFYEQSFMNNYFNRRFLVNYSIASYVHLFAGNSISPEKIIHHFCDVSIPYKLKLEKMQNWYTQYWDNQTL